MNNFAGDTLFFGVVISLIGYEIGALLKRKLKLALFNPLLISIIFVMVVLSVGRIDYDSYYEGAKYLSYLLTPATVCLAVPLYEQLELLKKHKSAIVAGIISGVIASMGSVLLFAVIFHLNHEEYVTLLPKSITTAIGMGVSEELGGIVTITVAVIIITGVLGNMIAEVVCRVFHRRAGGKGTGTRYFRSCNRNRPCHGNGRSRRSNEQSCHCSSRTSDGSSSNCIC